MDLYSPVLSEAYHLLQQDLLRHLEEAEYLAEEEWSGEHVELVRMLLPELVTVIRGVLCGHRASTTGDCPTCKRAWPCPVVSAVHSLVKDPRPPLRPTRPSGWRNLVPRPADMGM